eukprot:g1607.t1
MLHFFALLFTLLLHQARHASALNVSMDIIYPLPGAILQPGDHAVTVDVAFDMEVTPEYTAALRCCIELDLRSLSCFPVMTGGRPKLRDLRPGKHTLAVFLVDGEHRRIGRAFPVTFFCEDLATMDEKMLGRHDDLNQIAIATGTDKSAAGHFYTRHYPLYLEHLRHKKLRILEIGCKDGNSLWMWQTYFPEALIVGLDVLLPNATLNHPGLTDRVMMMTGDQANRRDLQHVIDQMGGGFDIIVDDGGHTMMQQQVSLGFLFAFLRTGGLYIIEDLATSKKFVESHLYNPERQVTTLSMLLSLIEHENIGHSIGYMLPEEAKYVERHVASVNVHFRRNMKKRMPKQAAGSIFGVLRKADDEGGCAVP